MRIRFLLLCVSAGLFVSGFAIQACGSTTSEEAADAGADAFEAGVSDTSVADAADAAPQCDPNKDFLVAIQDASMADGATSTGLCIACARDKCKAELGDCSKDCACQGIAGGAIDCYMKGGDVFACGSDFIGVSAKTRNIGIALMGCLNKSCPTECATAALTDAGDGGD